MTTDRPRHRWRRRLLWLYLVLLLASHLVRMAAEPPPLPDGDASVTVSAVDLDDDRRPERTGDAVRVAFRRLGEAGGAPVVLLHGSPGRKEHLLPLARRMAARGGLDLIVPDLPGFGASTQDLPDTSLTAQADLLAQALDAWGLPSDRPVHLVGFSMGGGVALRLYEQAPRRVASLTLLSSIGVQELELLGEHTLNRSLHWLQLATTWTLLETVPHFGAWDGHGAMGHARIFYDTDQRPLRGILKGFAPPLLVIHGERDFLVPVEAAREHARIVPQAELDIADASHFMVFNDNERLAERIGDFVARAERGEAATRADATAPRVAAAQRPFDASSLPPFQGPLLVFMLVLIAAATLVSEDLACIGAGLLAAQGRMSFLAATGASMAGIFIGDMGLFLAGRLVGRAALRHAPLKWLLRPETVQRSEAWFARRGLAVVFICRLLPGWRLPTYFAAGVVGTGIVRFGLCFLLAAAVWTPLLVGVSMLTGKSAQQSLDVVGRYGVIGLVVVFFLIFLVVKIGVPLLSHRGRRGLLGRWRRITRWEFWPPWVFYPPVVVYVAWLALRHRGLGLMTAANPGIPTGGFIGESKTQILDALAGAGDRIVKSRLLPAADETADETGGRLDGALDFMAQHDLAFPVLLKPDVGQRGQGVTVVRDREQLESELAARPHDTLIQEYVSGVEYGVFYVRHPGDERGSIFSITEKRMPVVTGDGRRSLEDLILDDDRAVAMARAYEAAQSEHLADVPAAGEEVQLVDIGTHCRGAVFLDGGALRTEALEAAIDEVSRHFDGFHFGRYDLRTPSADDLKAGRFTVIELNGLTSEATHIYDPRYSVLDAWRVLCRQWRLAFGIAAANKARGAKPTSVLGLVRALIDFARQQRD